MRKLVGGGVAVAGVLLSTGCAQLPFLEVQPCETNRIQVTAYVDQADYGPEEIPEIWLGVRNTGWFDCEINGGTDTQQWSIHAGPDKQSELIWSSTDCVASVSKLTVRLKPWQERLTLPLSWDRTRSSSDDCLEAAERPKVEPGVDYWFRGEIAGVETVEAARIRLR